MKKKNKKNEEENSSWFADSALSQMFLWRVKPKRDCILLAGNQRGYQKLDRALSKLSKESPYFSLRCQSPQIAPPAQWSNSPLARRKEATIQEIEKDLKSTVGSFDGFVWYQGIDFVLSENVYSNCVWHGNNLKVSLDGESVQELRGLLEVSSFPMASWVEIATLRESDQRLCLAGDWLGSE